MIDNLKLAYIAELEQRLNDWWNEVRELEVRMKKANVESSHKMFIQIEELRQKSDETKELLQSLRETDHSEWQSLKQELDKGWKFLRTGLDHMAHGFSSEWDEHGR